MSATKLDVDRSIILYLVHTPSARDAGKRERQVYNQLLDDEVDKSIVLLAEPSEQIKNTKQQVLDNFAGIISMKSEVLKITRDTQRSHTFTNSSGDKRVSIGYCVTDGRATG